jgi:transcriptional regulator
MRQLTPLSALSELSGISGVSGLSGLPDVTVALAPDCPPDQLEGHDGNVPLVGYLVLAPAGTQLNELLAVPGTDRRKDSTHDQEHDRLSEPNGAGVTGVNGVEAPAGPGPGLGQGLDIDLDKRTVTVDGAYLRLTYLEFELLAHLVKHPHRVYTREQLVATIWGYGPVGDQRTVDVHIARLRRKLGGAYRGRIVTIRRVGYKYVPAG